MGPTAAVWDVYVQGKVRTNIDPQAWIIALGGVGICLGLMFFGRKVMATVGANITKITPSRGMPDMPWRADPLCLGSRVMF